jgi:hypothetical protein
MIQRNMSVLFIVSHNIVVIDEVATKFAPRPSHRYLEEDEKATGLWSYIFRLVIVNGETATGLESSRAP